MSETKFGDIASGDNQRAILANIKAKQAHKPKVNANGTPIEPTTPYVEDEYGRYQGAPGAESAPDPALVARVTDAIASVLAKASKPT